MALVQRHGADVSGSESSPSIWNRVSWSDVFHGKMKHFYEDFHSWATTVAESSNAATYQSDHPWLSYEDTGDVPTVLATDDNGVLNLAIAATDNNESWLQAGGSATSVMFTPKTKANSGTSIFFEARVNMSTLVGSMFVGLAQEGSAAADFIDDAGSDLADKDYIGFLVDEDAPTIARFVYHKASGTAVNVSTDVGHTFVADTFVKLGFIIDMEEGNSNRRIKVFVNGAEIGDAATNTQFENTTDFPSGEEMHAIFGGKNNNAAKTVRCDWVRVAQYKSGN